MLGLSRRLVTAALLFLLLLYGAWNTTQQVTIFSLNYLLKLGLSLRLIISPILKHIIVQLTYCFLDAVNPNPVESDRHPLLDPYPFLPKVKRCGSGTVPYLFPEYLNIVQNIENYDTFDAEHKDKTM